MATKKTKKPTTKRGRKQDRQLVAAKQLHEVKVVAKKTKKPQKAVRAAVKKVGNSRVKVVKELNSE